MEVFCQQKLTVMNFLPLATTNGCFFDIYIEADVIAPNEASERWEVVFRFWRWERECLFRKAA